MDSLDARLNLSRQLSTLLPARQISQDLAAFMIKGGAELKDDLYPVILETLTTVDLNVRLNIFGFIEELIHLDLKSGEIYLFLIILDLPKVMSKLLPQAAPDRQRTISKNHDERLLMNLHSTYSILLNISKTLNFKQLNHFKRKFNSNDLLDQMDINRIKADIKFNESEIYNKLLDTDQFSTPDQEDLPELIQLNLTKSWDFLIGKKKQSKYERLQIDTFSNTSVTTPHNPSQFSKSPANSPSASQSYPSNGGGGSAGGASDSAFQLTPKLILQRIEADRERQKKGKETTWQITNKLNLRYEFEEVFNERYGKKFDIVEDGVLVDELNNLYQSCLHTTTSTTNTPHQPNPKPSKRGLPDSIPAPMKKLPTTPGIPATPLKTARPLPASSSSSTSSNRSRRDYGNNTSRRDHDYSRRDSHHHGYTSHSHAGNGDLIYDDPSYHGGQYDNYGGGYDNGYSDTYYSNEHNDGRGSGYDRSSDYYGAGGGSSSNSRNYKRPKYR